MKLIQQSKLFFKEGNSDKVYEIDLCALSDQEYLVNFRYGKRGGSMKEGTKTPAAVTREQADILFSGLENEKRKKGYQTETEVFITLPSLDAIDPRTAKGAILQRLQDAVSGTSSFKTAWKTSRVIWKAGTLQLTEAIPFIIKLATRGDEMQAYASLRSLIRMKATQALPVFESLAGNIRQKPHIRHLAWEGLLSLSPESEQAGIAVRLTALLPTDLQHAMQEMNAPQLATLIRQQSQEGNVHHFSMLYLLSKTYDALRPLLLEIIQSWAFQPPYFRQIRAIYRLAQLRKDAAVIAVFSYRFEKEKAMFRRKGSLDSGRQQYVFAIGKYVHIGAELKSGESRLAFSSFTKTYFQKNAAEYLKQTGQQEDARDYLKLAIATLLQFNETDYSPAVEQPANSYGRYDYRTRIYTFTLISYPECSDSLLLSTILFGNDPARILQPDLKFITGKRTVTSQRSYYSPDSVQEAPAASTQSNTSMPASSVISTAVNALKNLFGKKTPEQPVQAPQPEVAQHNAVVPPRPELYPTHWDSMPEAYIQLLMQAKMKVIHRFAYNNLEAHPAVATIISRFDANTLLQLLNSSFEIPAAFGFKILQQRADEFCRQPVFMGQVLHCNSTEALTLARNYIDRDRMLYCDDLDFILLLLLNTREENNAWIDGLLQHTAFPEERIQAIIGKTISGLLPLENTPANNNLARNAVLRLNHIAARQLERISWGMVEQLIAAPLEANKILAGHIMIAKSAQTDPASIPLSLTNLFLASALPEVREKGIHLLAAYPAGFLADHLRFVLELSDSSYPDISTAMFATLRAILPGRPETGAAAIRHLLYALVRKEQHEGAHVQISRFMLDELQPYVKSGLQPKDVTKLIHSSYRTGQLTGYDLLKAYDNPDDFSIPQIISFGSHELLVIRQWCWQYFNQHVPRIRFERENALNLLDARWDDTRAFAFHFFKTSFTEADWDAGTLIGIVDSIRPDVEQFGKELITLYFNPEQAEAYLTRLSEHPSVKVQAFVTSYLSLYAAGKPELLQQLEFYFRSVLTRVNKARVAKNRIFRFLHQEALNNEAAAAWITPLMDDLAAQDTIRDKATCIYILTEIKNRYPHLDMHLAVQN